MLPKSVIKHVRSLHLKKFRDANRLFIVEGPKMVQELILSGIWQIEEVFALDEWHAPSSYSGKMTFVSFGDLERISLLQSPNKVLAVVKMPDDSTVLNAPTSGLHLLVDHVQDPGNLGTIIRIADWFGIETVYCSLDTVEKFNPKVIQATMGSVFRVPVHYVSLTDLLIKNSESSRLQVFATLLEGENIFSATLDKDALLIVGNESKGVNPLLIPFVNKSLHIPSKMRNGSRAESLNVAIATGIVCAEFSRNTW